MQNTNLQAVIIGAGWAGEGHTVALRHCGVDVVAICARQSDVVKSVAARLEVPEASTDWRRTLEKVKPQIVALATPASLRKEVIEATAALGAHILCDKPLATTANEAKYLYECVEQAGIKHAYAATHKYDPGVAWAAELLKEGAIGQVQAVDCLFRYSPASERQPWTWMDSLELGGGMLNNGFTHVIAIIEKMIGSQALAVTGQPRYLYNRKPVLPDIHDFRQAAHTPTEEEAAKLEWRECDADGAFSALMRFAPAEVGQPEIQVCVIVDIISHTSIINGWYFYGTQGVIVGKGILSPSLSRQDDPESEAVPIPTPQRLLDQLPKVGDDVQNKWVALARDFVADIRGETYEPYLTFFDGWRYQEAIDAIRSSRGWCELPS